MLKYILMINLYHKWSISEFKNINYIIFIYKLLSLELYPIKIVRVVITTIVKYVISSVFLQDNIAVLWKVL